MRRNAISSAVQEEEAEINMTPMLDVVFIMLIFFIVTANFIKEPGLEINRPESNTSEIKISVLIDKKNTKKALIALHKEFKLDNKI